MIATTTRQGHKCRDCFAPWDCGRDDCAHADMGICPTCMLINTALATAGRPLEHGYGLENARGPVASARMTPAQYRASLRGSNV